MADRIAENADLIVDEMKRKARRRLVGAVVLALAAAIILPMLLEKEPRPLGDDVSVRIPPIDESKFINRLTGKPGDAKALPKIDDKVEAKASAAKPEPKAEVAAPPPAAAPAAAPVNNAAPDKAPIDTEARPPAPSSNVPANASGDATPASETRVDAKSAGDSKPRPTDAKSAMSSPLPITQGVAPSPASKVDGYVVQLAAFADDKGANSLANKLKRAGYAAFVEPVQTSRGTLWRVRVGGYGSKVDAEAARVKLKGEGFSGIVAQAK